LQHLQAFLTRQVQVHVKATRQPLLPQRSTYGTCTHIGSVFIRASASPAPILATYASGQELVIHFSRGGALLCFRTHLRRTILRSFMTLCSCRSVEPNSRV